MPVETYPVKTFSTCRLFETWMEKNHGLADGIWVKIAKASTGIRSINHAEALEVALCYGWIDGTRRRLDELYFVQKFTPRRSNSPWSVINKKKAAELIMCGKMKEAGIVAIETAKQNGQWEKAYEPQSSIAIPADLQELLDNNPKAKAFFAKLNSQNRYAILYRIGKVKKPETRQRKMEEYIAMLEKHETIYPQ